MFFFKLGWRPFKDTYIQHNLPTTLLKEHVDLLEDMFNWLVDPCIEFMKFNCKFHVQTSYIHLMTSMMRLFSCLLDEISVTPTELSPSVVSIVKSELNFKVKLKSSL